MKREKFISCIPTVEGIIGYTFRDKSLLIQAFTRTSYCNEHSIYRKPRFQSNEVLEFFGDSVLSLSIITHLLAEKTERYEFGISTALTEGDFSNIKSKLSDKKNLSASTLALGLEKYLIMGEGDEKLGVAREPSVMEDLFESIIGAVYIDTDMDVRAVMKTVSRMLDMSVYNSRTTVTQSAKNALQEWCADKRRRLEPPVYKTLSEEGPDHKKIYERGVYVCGELIARAKGKNFKLADAACAELALEKLSAKERDAAKRTPARESAPEKKPEGSPTVKARRQVKPTSTDFSVYVGSSARLKDLAQSKKTALPRFRDLGESTDGTDRVYRVECILGEISETGTAPDRKLARERASALVLDRIAKAAKKPRPDVSKKKTVKK